MRLLLLTVVLLASCASPRVNPTPERPSEVLVFSRTAGFRHSSIEVGAACVAELASELGLRATLSEDPAHFTDEGLAAFACVVFLNTTGDVLDEQGQAAFERYIRAGGGYLGVHAATDTEFDWPWYMGLAGAKFEGHPRIQKASLVRTGVRSDATEFLPERWERSDEWYNFKAISEQIQVLLTLDESSYEGGTNGEQHPAAWCHEYDGGRAFYTAGGHTEASYSEPFFRQHLQAALRWTTQ